MADIRAKIEKEREAYEQELETEASKTKEELEKSDQLVPISDTGKSEVDEIMRTYYPAEMVETMKIPSDRVPAIVRALKLITTKTLKYSTPIVCLGPKCPMNDVCVLQKSGVAPISAPCPIELMLIDKWEAEYMHDLCIDHGSKVEMDLMYDMIESDLIDWRTSQMVAKEGLFDWNAIGMTRDGHPIIAKQESIALGIKLKFKNRKDRIREDLMATRKIKAKFGLIKNMDPSKTASMINDRWKQIQEARTEDAE